MPDKIISESDLLKEFDVYYPELLTEAGEVSQDVKQFISRAYRVAQAQALEWVEDEPEEIEELDIDGDFMCKLNEVIKSVNKLLR